MSGHNTLMEKLFYSWNRFLKEEMVPYDCEDTEFNREQFLDDEKNEFGKKVKVPKEKRTTIKICKLKKKEPKPVEETEKLPPSEKLKRKREREQIAREKARLRAKEAHKQRAINPLP